MSNRREGGTLTSETERWEFGVGDYSSCLFGGIDHGDHETAIKSAKSTQLDCGLTVLQCRVLA
jgi:hypothetical protein